MFGERTTHTQTLSYDDLYLYTHTQAHSSLCIYLVGTISSYCEIEQVLKEELLAEEGITPLRAGARKGLYLNRYLVPATAEGFPGTIKTVFYAYIYNCSIHTKTHTHMHILYSVPNALLIRSHISYIRVFILYMRRHHATRDFRFLHTSQRSIFNLVPNTS